MIWAAMAVAPASATGVNLVAREARFPRFVALLLDTIFVSVITLIATSVYGVTVITWGSTIPTGGFATWGTETTLPGIWTAAIWLAYYTVCEALFGATPGKALNGLVVVSADGRPLTVGRIVGRNLLRLLDALPAAYLLGGLFVLSTANSQRVGDLAAHTTVVLRRRVIDPGITRSSGRTARLVLVATVAALLVFTGAFDYFGRPPLVIQGLANTGQLHPIRDYELGSPSWGFGTVTYPIRQAGSTCAGTITLEWSLSDWHLSSMSYACL